MTAAADVTLTRTVSHDGTELGFWTSGNGPPVVLVNGPFGDHTRWDVLRPHLEPHVTVHAMDRRGRGASGDHPDWSLEREYEDVAAVVDSVAEATGEQVAVYGHSGGGMYAWGAALLTSNIGRLILYEGWPPMNPEQYATPPEVLERMESFVAAGDPEGLLETVFRELVKVTDEELEHVRAQPSWAGRVAAAHTGPRELRAIDELSFDPEQAARVTVPTLLLVGEESPILAPEAGSVAAALPDARIAVLSGQAHEADITGPQLVAEEVLAFLGRER